MSDEKSYGGISVKEWKQAFRPGMPEYAASRFCFSIEALEMVRIAFGNHGPYVDDKGTREAAFTHAVTLSPDMAVELARMLLKAYAAPVANRAKGASN